MEKVVVMASDRLPTDMFGPEASSFVQTVSVMMGAKLMAPDDCDRDFGPQSVYSALSEREEEVLRHLARGSNNTQIAHTLNVAEVTVRLHLRNARHKMGAATREQALALAITRGFLQL